MVRREGELYWAYGLTFRSELSFPELSRAEGAPDAEIRFERLASLSESGGDGPGERVSPKRTSLELDGLGVLSVSDGRLISINPLPGAHPAALRLAVLGTAMGLLLRQRGYLVLHASAVFVGGRGVAFVGDTGQGKSTTAAALCAHELELASDDVTAVSVDADGCNLVMGYGQLKVSPDVAAALGHSPHTLPRLIPNGEKRALAVGHSASRTQVPLRRVYALAEGPALRIAHLGPHDAFLSLVRHTYRPWLLPQTSQRQHFEQCATLATRVGVSQLDVPRDLAALPALARLVLEDLGPAHVEV